MDWMEINPRHRDRLAREGLSTAGDVLALARGEVKARSRTTRTIKVAPKGDAADKALYVKIYRFPTARDVRRGLLRGTLLGRPRAEREWRALGTLALLGCGGVEPVAWGWRRQGPFVRATFLVTLEGGRDLTETVVGWEREKVGHRTRRRFIEAFAGFVRMLHEAHFRHGDLFLRNVVVEADDEGPRFRTFDCPKGRLTRGTGPLVGAAIGDLASLEAGASAFVSRSDRLRFLLAYARRSRLTDVERAAIRGIVAKARKLAVREGQRVAPAAKAVEEACRQRGQSS